MGSVTGGLVAILPRFYFATVTFQVFDVSRMFLVLVGSPILKEVLGGYCTHPGKQLLNFETQEVARVW